MKLVVILLAVVSILATLSGFSIFLGSRSKERSTTLWFFVATLGASLWAVSIATFLTLTPAMTNIAPIWVAGIFAGSVLMDIAILGYTSWDYKIGKVLTIAFAVVGCGLVGILIQYPTLLYSSIELSAAGNTVRFIDGWYFWSYGGFIGTITMVFSVFLLNRILKTRAKRARKGLLLFFGGLSITGVLSLVFDLLFPILLQRCDLLWVGPLAIGVTVLAFYFAILYYGMLPVSTGWMKITSFVILFTSGVALYMLIFYALFSTLFGIASPSWTIIIFNLLMALIVLLLTPAISEVSASILSMISTRQFNVSYVVKKLDKVSSKNTTLKELAAFLASHLHFSYVSILTKDKFYNSGSIVVDTDELTEIAHSNDGKLSVWQVKGKHGSGASLVANLKNKNGEVFGKIIFGKNERKKVLTQKEMMQIELIANLTAMIIETEKFVKE